MQDRIYRDLDDPGQHHPDESLSGLKSLWRHLTTPSSADQDDARREYMTRVILIMVAVILLVFSIPVILGWVAGAFEFFSVPLVLLCNLVIFTCLWITQRGFWRLSRFFPPTILFSLATLITYQNGYLNTGLLFYAAGILLTSMLIGIQAQWVMVLLSSVTYLVAGWLSQGGPWDLVAIIAITVTSSFTGIASLQWLMVDQLQNAIQHARLYAEKLELRTRELARLNRDLNQQVLERKHAEKRLRESEERYHTLFENAPIGLALVDLEGNILDFNTAMLEPGGYLPENRELYDNASKLYYDPEDRAEVLSLLDRQGFLKQKEVQFRRKDGTPYDALLSLTPVRIDDKPYLQVMVEDVTLRKKAQDELLNLNRALKVLSSGNQAVIRATDEITLLNEICRLITQDAKYRFAWVGYPESEEDQNVRPVAYAGFDTGFLSATQIKQSGNGGITLLTESPTQSGQTSPALNIDRDQGFTTWSPQKLARNYASSISLPLVANEQTIGTLFIYSRESNAFHPEEVKLLTRLADNLAFGIATLRTRAQHHQAKQRIQKQLETMSALRTVDMTITSSLDLRFTFDVLLNQIINTLQVDAATILIYKPQIQTLDFAAGRGFHTTALQHTHLRLGQGNAGRAALEREIVHIPNLNDLENEFEPSPKFPDENFTLYFGVPLIAKGQIKGVLEIFKRSSFNPDDEWVDLLRALAAQAAIAIDNAELFNDLQESNQDLLMAYEFTLEGWAKALELRDAETEGHTQRVVDMTLRLARRIGVSEELLVHIRRGVLLHDIGKMGIPDSILLKPGPLTEEEWEVMRQHPVYAQQLLSAIPYLRPALDIPYCHHEKWDGTGYPRGLQGEQIPLGARIFAVVDVWDALRSDRPYRPAWADEKVYQYIQEQAGQHFDPTIVQAFLKLI
jgi:PAS domain S-box-containing protein